MKPPFDGKVQGERCSGFGSQGAWLDEVWEWRQSKAAVPLFHVYSDRMGIVAAGLTREQAADLARCLLFDSSCNKIELTLITPSGDWHLLESKEAAR